MTLQPAGATHESVAKMQGGIRPWLRSIGNHGGLGGVLGRGTEAFPKRDETADVSLGA